MTRPLVIDAFMYHDEADILECRLTELFDAVDWFVLVDANVTHQDSLKPSYYLEEKDRFAPWADKIIHVFAKGLPPKTLAPDPWAREHAQREFISKGLARIPRLAMDSIVMQSDVDEIPTAVVARNIRPPGFYALPQRGHFWSLRWRYPYPWMGTVVGRAGNITSFGVMRDIRNTAPSPPGIDHAGWHLSWLPKGESSSAETAIEKVGFFCHPEVTDRIIAGVEGDRFLREGIHVDGVKMDRCEVDGSFPKWIRDGRCPKSWLQ